jgi:hypothetical protein
MIEVWVTDPKFYIDWMGTLHKDDGTSRAQY